MKRKTNAKPLIFTVEEYTVRSHKLGFLEANELLFKYLPIISGLTEKLKGDTDESGEVDMAQVFKEVPEGLIRQVCKELLTQTEVLDEEQGEYEVIDPNNFDSLQQCFSVIWQVFQFNFPDFFENGTDIQDLQTVPEKVIEVKEVPKNKEEQERIYL